MLRTFFAFSDRVVAGAVEIRYRYLNRERGALTHFLASFPFF